MMLSIYKYSFSLHKHPFIVINFTVFLINSPFFKTRSHADPKKIEMSVLNKVSHKIFVVYHKMYFYIIVQ
jgi:hypothetical protein